MYIVCAVYAWAAYFDIFPLIKLANNLILMPKEQTAMAVVKTINDTTTDDIETPHMWKSCYTQHTYTCIDYDDNENHRELHTIKCQLWWWWWRLDIRRKLQIGRPKRIEEKKHFIWREKFSKKKIHLRWFIIFFGIQNIKRPNHPQCIALFSHFYLLCLKSVHLCGSLSVYMFTRER